MVPQDESNFYMLLGLAFIFGPILLQYVSIFFRTRNLKVELELMEEVEE